MGAQELRSATSRQQGQADAAQRAQRAWAARVAGGTWEQVASLCGFASATIACRAVRRYFGKLPVLDHEELRDLWRARHETLWRQSQSAIADGETAALRAGVAIARSAAQLDGLDRPTRVEMYRPAADEFLTTVAALRAALTDGEPQEADIFDVEPIESD